MQDGEATEARPGRLIRGAQAAPDPATPACPVPMVAAQIAAFAVGSDSTGTGDRTRGETL